MGSRYYTARTMRWFRTLSSRIALLVAISALPALAAVWVLTDLAQQRDRAGAERGLATSVRAAAAEQVRLVAATRILMEALAGSTALALDYQEACGYLLQGFQRQYPDMVGQRVYEADGTLWCDGGEADYLLPSVEAGLALAQELDEFVVTEPAADPAGVGSIVLVLPFPVRNLQTEEEWTRYLVAGIELRLFSYLHEFTDLISTLDHGEQAVMYLTDPDGRVWVRVPESDILAPGATSTVAASMAAEAQARLERQDAAPVLAEQVGADGVRRLYAATAVRLESPPQASLLLVSGIPVEAIYGPATSLRRTGMLVIALAAVLVAVVGLMLTRTLLRNDIRPLTALTRELARGRIPEAGRYQGPDELRALRDAMIASARAQATSEDRLGIAMSRLDTYFRNSPLAFLELDAEFRIRMWTPAAERMFGWPEAEVLGRTPQELGMIHPDDRADVERMLEEVATTAGYRVSLNRNLTRGGKTLWCEWHNSLVLGPDHRMDSMLCIAHEVSERERARASIESVNRELEQRVAERTRELEAFSYTVSHDLRAPLRTIDGFARILAESRGDALGDEGQAQLQRIRNAAARMDGLIESMLALSRISRRELRCRTFDFSALCHRVADGLQLDETTIQRVTVDIQPDMQMTADPDLIRVAMESLLSNAVKFTRGRARARVEVGMVQTGDGPVYHVRDNGVGFDMRFADKLFGVFERLHPEEDFPGTGVGLATVERVVARHGGRVWAEGQAGVGAVFRFIVAPQGEG